ncbi:RluA family pseudouridine synthase [Lactobacillus taiwanensis]|uniref:RluA family pseudouridine synthase n=1 Tax=Lactobacillus taiwanensis TaxID=508451 RepID=UPI0025A63ECA|nr:RluA family pseudouridine synthase [Lactobacillus taiwanensis]
MTTYHYSLKYPTNLKPISVDDLMRKLLIPRKWRHFLRTENKILVNGKYLPLNFLVKAGDKIDIYLDQVESEQQTYPASGKLPEIIYEDSDVLVINKPAGQKTHPNLNETNTALNDCATYLGYSPYIVHRLDMLTNGLLLVAKNPAVVPILNRQLTNKTLHREYLAWVNKSSKLKQSGTISFPIGHDPNDQRKRMVHPAGQKAITHYEIVKEYENKVLVKLTLETGRTHQIRVHLAALNAPIIGDPLYNSNYHDGEKLQLTAYQLTFMRPFKFESKTVKLR